jgi:hypothetical protein
VYNPVHLYTAGTSNFLKKQNFIHKLKVDVDP